jgi:hypothetical protein
MHGRTVNGRMGVESVVSIDCVCPSFIQKKPKDPFGRRKKISSFLWRSEKRRDATRRDRGGSKESFPALFLRRIRT